MRPVDGYDDDGLDLPGWSIDERPAKPETWTVRWHPMPWNPTTRTYCRGVRVLVAAGVSKSAADAAMMRHPNRVECCSTPDPR